MSRYVSPAVLRARREVARECDPSAEEAYSTAVMNALGEPAHPTRDDHAAEAPMDDQASLLTVKYIHEVRGVCSGNIIWADRDRGDAYYRTSQFAMRAGRFPANHPCCPSDNGHDPLDGSQLGASESIRRFRAKGYWASCFPEGDGITLRCLNGQTADIVVRDIAECFGWRVASKAPTEINAREAHFRALKVKGLVAQIQKEGKSQLAAKFTEQEWWDLAHRAGVRKPSPTTKADVLGVTREAEEM